VGLFPRLPAAKFSPFLDSRLVVFFPLTLRPSPLESPPSSFSAWRLLLFFLSHGPKSELSPFFSHGHDFQVLSPNRRAVFLPPFAKNVFLLFFFFAARAVAVKKFLSPPPFFFVFSYLSLFLPLFPFKKPRKKNLFFPLPSHCSIDLYLSFPFGCSTACVPLPFSVLLCGGFFRFLLFLFPRICQPPPCSFSPLVESETFPWRSLPALLGPPLPFPARSFSEIGEAAFSSCGHSFPPFEFPNGAPFFFFLLKPPHGFLFPFFILGRHFPVSSSPPLFLFSFELWKVSPLPKKTLFLLMSHLSFLAGRKFVYQGLM